jgi:hypothetical protein
LAYTDLAKLQPSPYANLAHGGGGTAYALWRLGEQRRAKAWLTAALADRRKSAATFSNGWEKPHATSYHFGRGGLYWAYALLPGPHRDRAVAAFQRGIDPRGPTELVQGAAGQLVGARLLLSRFEHAGLRRTATALATSLGKKLRARSKRPWEPSDASRFAHGWSGVAYAFVTWTRAGGEELPPWLVDSLHRLAAMWSPATPNPKLAGSWCNGAAGATLLWSAAFAATDDKRFLSRARDAGRAAVDAELAAGTTDLCCGSGGVAYALLELDRVDAGSGWRARAREIGARAIQPSTLVWPNGLFRGHPGLVCLALDLVAETPLGFPTLV